jgi:3-mercaptopyruvate sulfurtransferase SseA
MPYMRQMRSFVDAAVVLVFAVGQTPQLRAKVADSLDAEQVICPCGAGAAAASLAHTLVRLRQPNVAAFDGGIVRTVC